MHVFEEYISKIGNPELKQRTQAILQWVEDTFPQLEPRIAWNQPMFTDHGTFIIGFSVAKHHISVAPEAKGIDQFSADIVQAGYDHGKNLFRMKESLPVDYPLLKKSSHLISKTKRIVQRFGENKQYPDLSFTDRGILLQQYYFVLFPTNFCSTHS